jgi:hypothetical protein
MKMATKQRSDYVCATAACVVVVGARPLEYARITVRDNKTGEMVTIDNQNEVIDAGDEGVAYAFRPFQKVHRMHPAVLASPGTFIPLDEVDTDIHPIVEAF